MEPRVQGLYIHPVKSLRGLAVDELDVTMAGPAGDREFLITDPAGRFLTQRQIPKMAKVTARRRDGRLQLAIDDRMLWVELSGPGDSGEVVVWSETVRARALGTEADRFLSEILGREARLWMYQPQMPRTRVSPDGATFETRFTDQAPVLLTADGSLAVLSSRLGRSLEIERFRPNIHLSGVGPWLEEDWRRLRIGAVELEFLKNCTRCKIITIDPTTADVGPSTPLELLKNDVKGVKAKADFGVHLRVISPGRIHLGDRVEILS